MKPFMNRREFIERVRPVDFKRLTLAVFQGAIRQHATAFWPPLKDCAGMRWWDNAKSDFVTIQKLSVFKHEIASRNFRS
jgi:hypothetical protein